MTFSPFFEVEKEHLKILSSNSISERSKRMTGMSALLRHGNIKVIGNSAKGIFFQYFFFLGKVIRFGIYNFTPFDVTHPQNWGGPQIPPPPG